jgi:sugar lactone lactonase YvrE
MTRAVRIHDDRACALGEGPLWHPERGQLFWFDIHAGRLMWREGDGPRHWDLGRPASAAGWVDRDRLLVATADSLRLLDLTTGAHEEVCPLEADDPRTRSNDGRADPMGGLWIGTMGREAQPEAGAIHRYYRGELRRLWGGITITNAICFDPEGGWACFADTARGLIWRTHLDRAGWPSGEPWVFLDLSGAGLDPDGAACDSGGDVWIAQWGAGRVVRHGPDGGFREAVALPATNVTCPSFGGADLSTLYVTSAATDLAPGLGAQQPAAGMTFAVDTDRRGQAEHRVVL